MKTIFDKIVLSETEPQTSELWMRDAIEFVKNEDGSTTKKSLGKSIWWFTPHGWKKLFDFDTRYAFTYDYIYNGSDTPLTLDSVYEPEHGISEVSNTMYLYDASRTIGNNSNLVIEKGLKYHVDDLLKKINALDKRLTKAEEDLKTVREDVNTVKEGLTGLTEVVEAIESQTEILNENYDSILERVAALENR